MVTTGVPLVTLLAQRAYEASVCVAALLDAAEHCLRHGREHTSAYGEATPRDLLRIVDRDWLVPRYASDEWVGLLQSTDATQGTYSFDRLASLVFNAWREQVDAPTSRPDILSIVCDFLANPDEPHTYDVVRFAVVLALRSQYRVQYTPEAVEDLRKSYDTLRARHSGKRLRVLKRAASIDYFLIDILCLDGRMRRRFSHAGVARYYGAFRSGHLGIENGRPLLLEGDEDSPRLVGEMPDFGTVVNAAFTQPTAIPGLDEVTGGLLGPVNSTSAGGLEPPNGVVTLIGGVPGSGKTSLALLLARRLAELGSVVSYVATEEEPAMLRAKAATMAEPLSVAFGELAPGGGSIRAPQLHWPRRDTRGGLDAILAQLRSDIAGPQERRTADPFDIPFPRVVVIDSITALLEATTGAGDEYGMAASMPAQPRVLRHELARILKGLRATGLCVVMIGSADDADDTALAYIVDNVFSLALDSTVSTRHPIRTIALNKTRLQRSNRGCHVFHLGGAAGCSVSPSLHSVLRSLKGRPEIAPDPERRAILWVPTERDRQQTVLDGIVQDTYRPITRRDRSQVLIYGAGSAGKARLALAMAIEPMIKMPKLGEDRPYEMRLRDEAASARTSHDALADSRLLILSFLYDERYYQHHLQELIRRRFAPGRDPDMESARRPGGRGEGARLADVVAFQAGYIDPETVVGRVRTRLRRADLEGRPYTTCIIDGVHNVLMQFPLLQAETLLWPALYRYLRVKGLANITTYTFFGIQAWHDTEPASADPATRLGITDRIPREAGAISITPAQQLFFHLLVGSCDYTYSVTRTTQWTGRGARREVIRVVEETSPDSYVRTPVLWDPANATFLRHS